MWAGCCNLKLPGPLQQSGTGRTRRSRIVPTASLILGTFACGFMDDGTYTRHCYILLFVPFSSPLLSDSAWPWLVPLTLGAI